MNKLTDLMKKNWFYIVGGVAGGVGGYLYWRFIGCSTGTCPITSSPIMSTAWGALMGGLLLSLFFSNKKNKI
jgi:uncharacterized membrane protein